MDGTEKTQAARRGVALKGVATSHGLASGPVYLHRGGEYAVVPEFVVPQSGVIAELGRYHAARAETRRQIESLAARLRAEGNRGGEADVFSNHLLMLDDASIVNEISRFIRDERLNAEAAIRRATDGWRELFGRMNDPYLRERVRDVDDIERRILRILLGREEDPFAKIDAPVVIVAEDLTPSETVALPRNFILGFATDRGSATSHVALLARALGIPAVVGLGDVTKRVRPGGTVLLDGTSGTIVIDPDDREREQFDHVAGCERELATLLAENRDKPCALADGESVRLCANLQPGVPLSCVAAFGAQGVGLYRSEYLWLGSETDPTEEEQTRVYSEVAASMAALGAEARVTFRCLDLGGDKLRRGEKPRENNPFLGSRSIRWLLAHREVLRTQLRAILKASAAGPSAVMYPMVSTIGELREANAELDAQMAALKAEGIAYDEKLPRGMMIEVPSAALNAAQFAREVDFFSIGTNDLTQYALAADRGNENVADLYHPSDPAVLKLVAMAARAAADAAIPVAVCGESAADPVLAALWLALGVNELSMSPSCVPLAKKALASFDRAALDHLADAVRAVWDDSTADGIYCLSRDFIRERLPEFDSLRTCAPIDIRND